MKKIALVFGRVYMGGTTEVAKMIGMGLAEKGYDVEFLILDKKAPGKDSLEESGFTIRQVIKPVFESWTFYLKKIGQIFSSYDGLIINGSFARIAHAALEFTDPKVAVINVQHTGVYAIEPAALTQDRWHACIGVSRLIGDALRDFYPTKRTAVILNGAQIPKGDFSHRPDGTEAVFRLAYVGRLRETAKRVSRLALIMKSLQEKRQAVHLDIIGDGPEKANLEKSFTDLGLMEKVTFHGKVNRESVYDLLSRVHASLLVSDFESFGLVLAEAQMCGAVPIATKIVGATDEIIEDGINGFLCPQNEMESFVDRIIELSTDRDLWKKMSDKAIETSTQKFSLERLAGEYEFILKEIWSGKIVREKVTNRKTGWMNQVEILAWPASGIKRITRKIQFSREELIGRMIGK